MFRFEHPNYLYALAVLPILLALYLSYHWWKKKAIRQFGEAELITYLTPQASKWKQLFKVGLLLLGFLFLAIGWANPQWGTKREKVTRKSADVFIALDISTSMLAEDTPPNRLDRAKKFAEDLVASLEGERVGLILFAGGAYLQMPLTTDYAAARLFLRSATPSLAGSQGTAIAEAVDLARRSFQPEEKNQHHKALIIISDGEDHEGEAPGKVASAHEEGILLFTVGVGTPEGAFIPADAGYRQDVKRDESGEPVRSSLNEAMLKELSEKGEGLYFHISQSEGIAQALQDRIDQMEKREFEVRAFTEHESYFQVFLTLALVFFILEFLTSNSKSRWLKGKDLFK
jgi:Ca-activated chloride channel family protein